MANVPQRKDIRLKHYDYSQPGYYFITICTYDMRKILGTITGTDCTNVQTVLTDIGQRVQTNLLRLPKIYAGVAIKSQIVMPNHIHFVVQLADRPRNIPLHRLIGQFKSYTARLYEGNLWQRGYYDRVIRSEAEYLAICEYIQTNPLKWKLDRYFSD